MTQTSFPNHHPLFHSALLHFDDFATVILDAQGYVVSLNHAFLRLFDFLSAELLGHALPQNIKGLMDSAAGEITFENQYKEKIQASYLISKLSDPEGNHYQLITFRDVSFSKTKDKFKAVMIQIAHVVNSAEDIEKMCEQILEEICTIKDHISAFICLYDTVNKTFHIHSQRGLNELYRCHSCSYLDTEQAVMENKRSCYRCYHDLKTTHVKLSHHAIAKYVDMLPQVSENYSVLHMPLMADGVLMGLLHIIGSTAYIKKLSLEKDLLHLLTNEITVGIKRIRLIQEIKQYADNLERVIKLRTDQLREKDAQLIQSGKMATLGELATGIAHEINQPLGGISLISQGLIMAKSRDKLPDSLLLEKLSEIVAQVERINNIITHLRTFARQTDNIQVEVDIRKPLLDVFKLIGQQLVNKEIEVILDIDEEIPLILAEHNRLEQVFLNLIGNARDALEDMEKTVLQFHREEKLPKHLYGWKKRIVVRSFRDNDKLVLEFIDNGTGIPNAVQQKIFEPFFTTKEVGRGTGLGLSITYGIVRDFSGTIDIESQELKGSKFIIKFPVYEKM